MKHLQSSNGEARVFLYDADDERIFNIRCAFGSCPGENGLWTATVRDLGHRVLRTFEQNEGSTWRWKRDHVYRGVNLLAAYEPNGTGGEDTRHFHHDHLGTPRQITDQGGGEVARHTYYPFGGEATNPNQNELTQKFTGHERDDNGSNGPGKLDYMHARYCSPEMGRFLSVDPIETGRAQNPQTWNKYTYSLNNPIRLVDPDGRKEREGIAAGIVQNKSSIKIFIAADDNGIARVFPLNPGELSTDFIGDADAIIVDGTANQSLNGVKGGVFKVGPGEFVVEDGGAAASVKTNMEGIVSRISFVFDEMGLRESTGMTDSDFAANKAG